jgi:CelD/BcsL family acetyltransferase involved in cellulose biosynthesis
MNVYSFDPLRDPRWAPFVERAAKASVFHTPGWLRALERTYGFTPIAFTTSAPPDALTSAAVFAGVRSPLTGHRLVSLPFSDHCEPLVEQPDALEAICGAVLNHRTRHGFAYVEMRPVSTALPPAGGFAATTTYALHRLDLRPGVDALFRSFHKDSIQRKIRRAEREGLTYEAGRTDKLLRDLHYLLDLTRRRHRAPLQPMAWFRNLVASLGDSLCVHIAYHGQRPAAGILTLSHGRTMVYKYGGSDTHLNPLGGTPLLFWKAIQGAKAADFAELDFGRSDEDNPGLMAFKSRWGARHSTLTYWRAPGGASRPGSWGWKVALAGRVLTMLPGPVRRAAGAALYPHIG